MPNLSNNSSSVSVVGTATFNPSSGAIVNLQSKGVVTGVVYVSQGRYRITHSLGHTNYAVSVVGSDDSTITTMTCLAGNASVKTGTQFEVQAVGDTGTLIAIRNPQVMDIAIFA